MGSHTSPLADDLRLAIEDFLSCSKGTIASLRDPFASRATADPSALLGAPILWTRTLLPSPLKDLAGVVTALGGGAAPLRALVKDDALLDGLVESYKAGAFAVRTAAAWIVELALFEQQIEADAAAARAAIPRWSLLQHSKHGAPPDDDAGTPDILTPEQAVKLMGGSISVAGLRARIRKGVAGPWTRVGGKLQIRASAFLGHHASRPEEAQALAQRRGQVIERLAEQHPPRRRVVPRLGSGGGGAASGGNGGQTRPAT